jgi:hypothetical protein
MNMGSQIHLMVCGVKAGFNMVAILENGGLKGVLKDIPNLRPAY